MIFLAKAQRRKGAEAQRRRGAEAQRHRGTNILLLRQSADSEVKGRKGAPFGKLRVRLKRMRGEFCYLN